MASTTNRTDLTYLVLCDCERCQHDTGFYYGILDSYLSTKDSAIKAQKKFVSEHPSCYLATQLIKPIPLAHKKAKTRKAA